MLVRRLGPQDWRAWRTVRQRSLREDPDAFAETGRRWLHAWDHELLWRERLVRVETYVADVGGELVGTVGLEVGAGELVGLWVTSAQRGRGVARALVATVLESAGAAPVSLRVHAENARAIAFYERCGFAVASIDADEEGCVSMASSVPG